MQRSQQHPEGASLEEIIGDPRQVDAELQQYRKDSQLLSRRPHLVAQYSKQWIAIYNGQVRADADSLDHLLVKLDAAGVPRDRAVVRFVDRNLRKMIL